MREVRDEDLMVSLERFLDIVMEMVEPNV